MSLRVFLTDDVQDTIEALTIVYDNHPSFEVVGWAANADEAMERLRCMTDSVDIVSLDIQLGNDCGFDVCRRIKAEFPHLFVVMCSLEASDTFRNDAEQAGASYFVSKPVENGALNKLFDTYHESRFGSSKAKIGDNQHQDDELMSLLDLLDHA